MFQSQLMRKVRMRLKVKSPHTAYEYVSFHSSAVGRAKRIQ
jgi:hypothetical protein